MSNGDSGDKKACSSIRLAWKPDHYNIGEVWFHKGLCYPSVEVDVNKTSPYPYSSIVVGVFGSAYQGKTPNEQIKKEKAYWNGLARELGENIALFPDKNMVLLNGACPGLPHYAAEGAAKRGGFVAGISAADGSRTHAKIVGRNLALHQKTTHNFIVYPRLTYDLSLRGRLLRDMVIDKLKMRNIMNTEFSDVAIALQGSYGSLFEIAMALHPNYSIVGVLTPNEKKTFKEIEESGKWYFGDFINLFHQKIGNNKSPEIRIIPKEDPKELVRELYSAWKDRQKLFDENRGKVYHPSMERPLEQKIIKPLEYTMGRWPSF